LNLPTSRACGPPSRDAVAATDPVAGAQFRRLLSLTLPVSENKEN